MGKQQVVYADDAMPYFKVPYQDGRLEARAYVNGIVVAHTLLETPRELKKIKLTTAALPRVIEDPSVLIIDLELVDKNGTLLNGKDEEVDFIVDESLNLLGVENADQSNHRSYTDTTQSTYKGKLRAYFKKTGKAGELKIIPKNKKLKTLSYTVK
mgnify:FL=1